MTSNRHNLQQLLLDHRAAIESIVRREAGVVLLRFEAIDDLLQGVSQEAVKSAAAFRYEGHEAFIGWMTVLARRFLSGRRDYWLAHKRNPGQVLRLTFTGAEGRPVERRELADTSTGPATFAFRREQLVLATRALAMLLPRDREIVTWLSEGSDTQEIAHRLDLSLDAAEKARTRALERLRKAFAILGKSQPSDEPKTR